MAIILNNILVINTMVKVKIICFIFKNFLFMGVLGLKLVMILMDGEDFSGTSVSISDDISVAIGAYGNDGNGSYSGHVRIYQNNGGIQKVVMILKKLRLINQDILSAFLAMVQLWLLELMEMMVGSAS